MKNPLLKPVLLTLFAASLPGLHAATINQITNVPAGTNWNASSVWGSVPNSSNDYATTAGLGGASTAVFTLNGTTWSSSTNMRDAETSSTFAGHSLIINSDTRLLSKALNGATSTADIVMNGGFITSAPNTPTIYSSTLAGTITNNAPMSAIGVIGYLTPATSFTFNINSTITGTGTIQLALYADATVRYGKINLTGNIDNFEGTLYMGVANNIGAGSGFSIAAANAPAATLNLATGGTNFNFNLNSNLTFGSVIIGATTLTPGTYDYTALNAMAPGKFTDGLGSITVIPEPSTYALALCGLSAVAVMARRRQLA